MIQPFRIGTRSSKLAMIQAQQFAELLRSSNINVEIISCSSPGDRDKCSDLRTAEADFFTKDLDDAIINGTLDCAVHSAKDLPEVLNEALDFFWLPIKEDQRDVIIACSSSALDHEMKVKIGVSSERREQYAKQRWKNGICLPVRGTIEERLLQLQSGKFDVLIMAAAALKRLNLEEWISEYIPLSELRPPKGQGRLAVTFLKNNKLMQQLRQAFVFPVYLVGAGPGNSDLMTVAACELLSQCDICFYDALGVQEVRSFLSDECESVFVGKRFESHSVKQDEISQQLVDCAKRGMRVVRLKGGDPGVFGRLAEETNLLQSEGLPFRVIPAISSMFAATTATGLTVTRRGESRSFTVLTPRQAGSSQISAPTQDELAKSPMIFFMATSDLKEICQKLMEDRHLSAETPATLIHNASLDDQMEYFSTVGQFAQNNLHSYYKKEAPGLFLVGNNFASQYRFQESGLLGGKRILIAATKTTIQSAKSAIMRYNGIPLSYPIIQTVLHPDAGEKIKKTLSKQEWIIISSPSSARHFLEVCRLYSIDVRTLPKLISCGPATSAPLRESGIIPDLEPQNEYSSDGMLKIIQQKIKKGSKLLRLSSNVSSSQMENQLMASGMRVESVLLYETKPIVKSFLPTNIDAIFFSSGSAIRAFYAQYPDFDLSTKTILLLGLPSFSVLQQVYSHVSFSKVYGNKSAGTAEVIRHYAWDQLNERLEKMSDSLNILKN